MVFGHYNSTFVFLQTLLKTKCLTVFLLNVFRHNIFVYNNTNTKKFTKITSLNISAVDMVN